MSKGKKAIIILIALAAIGGLGVVGMRNAAQQEDSSGIPKKAIPVQYELPHRQTITSKVTAKGTAELIDSVTLYPSTQAKISAIHVRVGDEIQAGDLIITYDAKTLETYTDQLAEAKLALKSAELALAAAKIPPTDTELLQADAQIRQAQKVITDIEAQAKQVELNIEQTTDNLSTAEKRAADIKALLVLGVATQKELDSAMDGVTALKAQLDGLRLQLETTLNGIPMAEENVELTQAQYNTLLNRLRDPRTQNQIRTLEVNVEQTNLRISNIQKNIDEFSHAEYAEASGTVLSIQAVEGDMAISGKPLLVMADTSNNNLVIRINIPENDAKNIEIGQKAEIKGAAFGSQVFDGHISKIHPLAERKQVGNSAETVLTVEVSPDDDTIKLRAGLTIETNIITGVQEDAMVVPLMSALSDPDSGYFVYIINEDYTVQKRGITLGEYSGLYVQADGVTEEDRIILNPSNQIKEDIYVRPITR